MGVYHSSRHRGKLVLGSSSGRASFRKRRARWHGLLALLPLFICTVIGVGAFLTAQYFAGHGGQREPTSLPREPETMAPAPYVIPAIPPRAASPALSQPPRHDGDPTSWETDEPPVPSAIRINRDFARRPPGTPLVHGAAEPGFGKTPFIWQIGHPDGLPEGPLEPLRESEYQLHRAPETPWDIGPDQPFPQTIGPGQVVVLRLRELPHQPLFFELLVNRAHVKTSSRPWSSTAQAEFIQVLFNGERLLDRWLQTSSNWLQVYIPAHLIKSGTNTLAIRNMASGALAVDTARLLERPEGDAFYVALADADWLDIRRSRSVPHMAINSCPGLAPLDAPAKEWLAGLAPVPGKSLEARWRDWQHQPPELPTALATPVRRAWYQQWGSRLQGILQRGAEPVLVIQTSETADPGWLLLAGVFRQYVRHWQISGDDPELLAIQVRQLRRLRPDAEISVLSRSRKPWPLELLTQATPALPLLSSEHIDESLMRHRQVLMRQNIHGPAMQRPGLHGWQLTGCSDFQAQNARLRELVRDVITWLHFGGGSVVIHGGSLGGSLFPESAESPSAAWPVLAPILQIGRGRGRRIQVNGIPYDSNVGLFDATWVAAETAADEVVLLAFADSDRQRQIQFQIPVPWSDTRVRAVLEEVRINSQTAPDIAVAETRVLDSIADGANGRLVEIRTRLPSLLRIRLQPESRRQWQGQPVVAGIRAPNLKQQPQRFVFSHVHARLPQGQWLEPLTDRQHASLDFGALSPLVQPRRCPATPGEIAGVRNVVPWARQSVMVDFAAHQFEHTATAAARFRLDAARFPKATHLLFWVYPRSSNGDASATLIAGTPNVRGEILLRTNRWHCLQVPLQPLLESHPRQVFWFYVWPHPKDCRRDTVISFEFNAFLASGRQLDDDRGDTHWGRLVPVKTSAKRSLFLFLGPPGKAVTTYMIPDLKMNIRKALVNCEGVQVHWRRTSRILQLRAERMPKHCAVAAELLERLPLADYEKIQGGHLAATLVELQH